MRDFFKKHPTVQFLIIGLLLFAFDVSDSFLGTMSVKALLLNAVKYIVVFGIADFILLWQKNH